MEHKFLSAALYRAETEIEVPAGESTEIIIDYVESDASALKLSFAYTLNPYLYLSNYNPKIQIGTEIQYISDETEDDLIYTCINRETTENILELKGKDFNYIILTIYNNSTSSIIFSKFEVYQSQDVSPTQFANVMKEDIVATNLIKTTTVVTEGLITDILETNVKSREVGRARAGQEVDYIRAEGIELGFYSAILGEETEQFSITTHSEGVETTHYYWWQSIEGENAYNYPTTIDPRDRIPGISDSDRDKFKYLVLKPTSLSKKLSFEFAYDENNHLTPSIILGAGVGGENSRAGKGYIYKNSNGFYEIYVKSDGEEIGIVMDDNGVHIKGWADQHCKAGLLRDNGFELECVGSPRHNFEYIFDDNGEITGYIMDQLYMTTWGYKSGAVGT